MVNIYSTVLMFCLLLPCFVYLQVLPSLGTRGMKLVFYSDFTWEEIC